MKLKVTLLAVTLFLGLNIYAQKENAPKFGKGLFNLVGKDSSFTMKIATRMQILAISQWENEDSKFVNPEQNFLVRRARLKFDGFAFTPKLKYKIELGLSNRDISGASQFNRNTPRYILDAVVMWNFHENFELWFGQTKLPGNIERVISSGNLQQVDRSLLNSRFNIDRDIGIQLRHHFNLSDNFLVREKLALSQGEGRNITEGNEGGHQYTARLELLPFGKFKSKGDYSGSDLKREETPKLMLAATYDINQDAVKTRSNLGSYMFRNDGSLYETTINTLFIDAMFKYKGFSFMAEYADRDADDPFAKNADDSPILDSKENPVTVLAGRALNLQTGYLLNKDWEISGRYTNVEIDKNISGKNETQYTLGISKYIVGHKLKVQSDISYLSLDESNDEVMFRLQLDVHF